MSVSRQLHLRRPHHLRRSTCPSPPPPPSSGAASSAAGASATSNKRPRLLHNSLWVDPNKTEMASVPPMNTRLPHCIARPYLSTKRTYMRITQHIHFTCYFISAQASQSCAYLSMSPSDCLPTMKPKERSQHHFRRSTRNGGGRSKKQGL